MRMTSTSRRPAKADDQLRSEQFANDTERFFQTYFDPYSMQLRKRVQDRPLAAIVIALGAGFLLGALWKK
jgi:ElaB/YqjD/DUF883 family membrane-anchored ribosome-binding protein